MHLHEKGKVGSDRVHFTIPMTLLLRIEHCWWLYTSLKASHRASESSHNDNLVIIDQVSLNFPSCSAARGTKEYWDRDSSPLWEVASDVESSLSSRTDSML
jgi:hypothetical protein